MESWRRQFYNNSFAHYGVSKLDGAKIGSGRYPLGSGEDPRALKERKTRQGLSAVGGAAGGIAGAALGTAAMLGVSAATGGTTFFMWPLIGAMTGMRIGALKGSEAADKLIEKNKDKEVKELQKEVVHYLDLSVNNKNLSDDDVDKIMNELAGIDTASNELTAEQGWKKYYSDTDIHNPKTMYDFEAKAYYQLKEDGHTREKYKTEDEIRRAAQQISVDQFAKVAEKNPTRNKTWEDVAYPYLQEVGKKLSSEEFKNKAEMLSDSYYKWFKDTHPEWTDSRRRQEADEMADLTLMDYYDV